MKKNQLANGTLGELAALQLQDGVVGPETAKNYCHEAGITTSCASPRQEGTGVILKNNENVQSILFSMLRARSLSTYRNHKLLTIKIKKLWNRLSLFPLF